MPKADIVINRPRDIVWQFFTDPDKWERWWGGALKSVEPAWEDGAKMVWAMGVPSPIVSLIPQQELQIEDTWMTTAFRLKDSGARATLMEIEFEPRGGASFPDGGSAHRAQTAKSLAAFKQLVESETVAPEGRETKRWWEVWK